MLNNTESFPRIGVGGIGVGVLKLRDLEAYLRFHEQIEKRDAEFKEAHLRFHEQIEKRDAEFKEAYLRFHEQIEKRRETYLRLHRTCRRWG